MKNNFWENFSDRGVFVVNNLAVIIHGESGKVLIGRREDDPYIKKLTWSFPGGRPAYDDDLEEYLKIEVKKKTGFDIEVGETLFAKTYPEDRRFLSIYHAAKIIGGNENLSEKMNYPVAETTGYQKSKRRRLIS